MTLVLDPENLGPVEVSVTRDGTEVVLSVRDHGLGLGSRDLKKVGERFWRSAHHRELPGTGLGLFIVRRELRGAGLGAQLWHHRLKRLQERLLQLLSTAAVA